MKPDNATCTVTGCNRPADGGTVCRACIADLTTHLNDLDWLLDELNLVTTRQTQYANPYETTPATGGETPLPVNLTAADITADLVIALQTWVKRLLSEHPGWTPPSSHVKAYARWLATRTDVVRNHHHGHRLVEAIDQAAHKARYTIDRPADRWYAGVCSATTDGADGECPEDLYAKTTDGTITCRRCGTHHDIARRREVLLESARNVLATATEAARAIVVWSDYERGEHRLTDRIYKWNERRRIEPRGTVVERGIERPLYRLGDILDLLEADATRRQEMLTASSAC